MRHRPLILLPLSAVLIALSALSGCASAEDDPAACVPLVDVTPRAVSPGDSITVVIDEGCDRPRPRGGWSVAASPVDKPELAVTSTSDPQLVDGFSVKMTVPASFPAGEAYAEIAGWDYSLCNDNGSCASPSGSFIVSAGQ